MKLTSDEWQDAADLLDQFAAQCEIAFEEHRPKAKRWCLEMLIKYSLIAAKRASKIPKS